MTAWDDIAERRICEAQARGELDDLPGAGAPLALEDDALVPEDLRVAHRILKNAGLLPPQLEPHREIREIEALLAQVDDGGGRAGLISRVNVLLARSAIGRRHGDLRLEQAYLENIADRLERARSKSPAR
jgi:hypothetical protein